VQKRRILCSTRRCTAAGAEQKLKVNVKNLLLVSVSLVGYCERVTFTFYGIQNAAFLSVQNQCLTCAEWIQQQRFGASSCSIGWCQTGPRVHLAKHRRNRYIHSSLSTKPKDLVAPAALLLSPKEDEEDDVKVKPAAQRPVLFLLLL